MKMDLPKMIEEIYTSDQDDIRETNGKLIAAEITNGGLALVEVVEALGEKLTSPEIQTRVVAMGLLAHVFDSLKPDFLSAKELTFIVEFLCDRLKDQHMVIPKVILCVQPIIRCKHLPEGSAVKLLRGLFQEANIQSHTHKHREAFFTSLQYILRNKLEEIKTMSSDFVMHFLQSMDGEKDPRNLMILFNCIPIIISNFPLMPFTEEFFEVLSCYFPIDFQPTFAVPGGNVISREDLSHGLNLCLSQTNQFVGALFPFLMEKLSSSVIDAKLDSLQLLGLCCERSYTPRDLNPHLSEIWYAMRREVFMGGNEEVEQACIYFLRKAFKLLSQNEQILKSSINMVFSECKHHLSEPELRLSQPASKVLTSIAESSAESCSAIILLTVPLLYEQFTVKTSSSERKAILSMMTMVISTLRQFPALRLASILPNWDEILGMWFTLLTSAETDFVVLGLTFFTRLLLPPADIENDSEGINAGESCNVDEPSRNVLQAHLLALLTKEDTPREIRSLVISTMEEMARNYSDEFVRTSVPQLLTPIEEMPGTEAEAEALEDAKSDIYSSLAACAPYMKVGTVVIPRLVKLLISCKENHKNYDAVLQCLSSIVEKACNRTASDFPQATNKIGREIEELVNFLSLHLQDFIRVGLHARSKRNSQAYQLFTTIVRNLIRVANETRQQELVDTFWNERVKSLDLSGLQEVNVTPGLLGEALLGSVRPSIAIVKKNELMTLLLEKVLSPLIHENELAAGDSGSGAEIGIETATHPMALDLLANIRLYAVLLNKAPEADFGVLLDGLEGLLTQRLELDETTPQPVQLKEKDTGLDEPVQFTDDLAMDVEAEAETEFQIQEEEELMRPSLEIHESSGRERRLITFFIWVVKALALRGFPDLHKWIDKMIRLLASPKYGSLVAAEGFSGVMTDCPFSLNAKSYCRYGFLYKQRIFQISIPKLVAAYKGCSMKESAGGKVKANYIRALTAQLKHVPHVVLEMELKNVLPLLVASLDFDIDSESAENEAQAPILVSTLSALKELLTPSNSSLLLSSSKSDGESSKSPLVDYFLDMTPRLLRLTQFKQQMGVRILALQCLQRCAKLPTIVIQPLKETVVRKLSPVLDDPKRLVRKEATLTRNIWILIGAPGGI